MWQNLYVVQDDSWKSVPRADIYRIRGAVGSRYRFSHPVKLTELDPNEITPPDAYRVWNHGYSLDIGSETVGLRIKGLPPGSTGPNTKFIGAPYSVYFAEPGRFNLSLGGAPVDNARIHTVAWTAAETGFTYHNWHATLQECLLNEQRWLHTVYQTAPNYSYSVEVERVRACHVEMYFSFSNEFDRVNRTSVSFLANTSNVIGARRWASTNPLTRDWIVRTFWSPPIRLPPLRACPAGSVSPSARPPVAR